MHTTGEGLFEEIGRLNRELAEEQQKNARLLQEQADAEGAFTEQREETVRAWAAFDAERQKNTLLREAYRTLWTATRDSLHGVRTTLGREWSRVTLAGFRDALLVIALLERVLTDAPPVEPSPSEAPSGGSDKSLIRQLTNADIDELQSEAGDDDGA